MKTVMVTLRAADLLYTALQKTKVHFGTVALLKIYNNYEMDIDDSFPLLKWLECAANPSFSLNADVKTEWSYTSNLPFAFTSCTRTSSSV